MTIQENVQIQMQIHPVGSTQKFGKKHLINDKTMIFF